MESYFGRSKQLMISGLLTFHCTYLAKLPHPTPIICTLREPRSCSKLYCILRCTVCLAGRSHPIILVLYAAVGNRITVPNCNILNSRHLRREGSISLLPNMPPFHLPVHNRLSQAASLLSVSQHHLILKRKISPTISTTQTLPIARPSAPDSHIHRLGSTAAIGASVVQRARHLAKCSSIKELGDLAVRIRDADNTAIVARIVGQLDLRLDGWRMVTLAFKVISGRRGYGIPAIACCVERLCWRN